MNSSSSELPPIPPPPGAVAALVNGFNAIANNVIVILFPVILDIFLWLGPRLKADSLLAPFMETIPELQSQMPAEQFSILIQFFTEFRNGLNLFSLVRTFPLGVFSLMSANISPQSPLGMRSSMDVPSWLAAFGLLIALTFLGWIAGSLYFRSVSQVALNRKAGPGIFGTLFQGVVLSGIWMVVFTLANLPILIAIGAMSILNALLRTVLLVILAVPISWLLLGIYYSYYGSFTSGQNILSSTRSSFRMLRFGLPPLGWFTMLAILISQGMDMLWRAAPANSWMMGVGIFGHAFVSTSLLAASFIYYRDLNAWIENTLQWLKKQNRSSAQV
jgi:hypothetical protein